MDEPKYAVDIVNTWAKKNPSLKFLLIGKGKIFEYYEKAKNITWLSTTLSHEEMNTHLNNARCALMPTRTDAQGVMACEMASIGMPLITSNISICHEIFRNFPNVVLVDNNANNIEATYHSLIKSYSFSIDKRYYLENTTEKEVKIILKSCEQ